MELQSRIFLILRYLYEKTDADHHVSTKDIKHMLEEKGIEAPVSRTIDSDIEQLIASGFDIVRTHENGKPACYKLVERVFDSVELKILIDAVAASRFISIERSKQMINRLASMAGVSDRPYLEGSVKNVASIKKAVGGTMYVADALFQAIAAGNKVQFQMIEYRSPDKKIVPHRNGKFYVVSPYATIWANDRYYLLAHEEERNIIITPRLDHIRKVKILDETITPQPKGFNIGYYYSSVYKMYDGPETEITIECENNLIGKFIDRFGMDFECVPVSEHSFQATVKTCIGNTFFGWLVQYAGQMTLKEPAVVVQQYRIHLKKALADL